MFIRSIEIQLNRKVFTYFFLVLICSYYYSFPPFPNFYFSLTLLVFTLQINIYFYLCCVNSILFLLYLFLYRLCFYNILSALLFFLFLISFCVSVIFNFATFFVRINSLVLTAMQPTNRTVASSKLVRHAPVVERT